MPKFVFIYHAPMTPAEATPPAPEQMEAVMGAWNAWAAKVGDGMVDFGTPAERVGEPGEQGEVHAADGLDVLAGEPVEGALRRGWVPAPGGSPAVLPRR